MESALPVLLNKIILGLLIGALGQAIRAIMGLKKAADGAAAQGATLKQVFDSSQLTVSLMIGAVAGGLASLAFSNDNRYSNDYIFVLLAAGYGGADFIEGFIRSNATKLPPPSVAQPPDGGSTALPRANPFGGGEPPGSLPRKNPFDQ